MRAGTSRTPGRYPSTSSRSSLAIVRSLLTAAGRSASWHMRRCVDCTPPDSPPAGSKRAGPSGSSSAQKKPRRPGLSRVERDGEERGESGRSASLDGRQSRRPGLPSDGQGDAPALPPNPRPRRHAFKLATVWLLAVVLLFAFGLQTAGLILGCVLVA